MDGRPARYFDEVHADASISVAAPTKGHVKLLTVLNYLLSIDRLLIKTLIWKTKKKQ
jgi:hypothetical protein